MIQLRSIFGLGLLLSVGAVAQVPPPPPPGHFGVEGGVMFQGGDFAFIRTEFGMENRVVKGAPYSAQAVTEFTQTLADGNSIHRTNTASIVRDSEGRTRREQTLNSIGSIGASTSALKSTIIHDPVAGVTYMLDPSSHTARMTQVPQRSGQGMQLHAPQGTELQATKRVRVRPNAKTEDLGTEVMEGLSVQGKRTTRTIPAGEIGNDNPLQIVSESWYSPELQTVVMSKTSDPRSGTTVYKLTNVNRAEPDPALFQVPSDYTVTEGRKGLRVNQ